MDYDPRDPEDFDQSISPWLTTFLICVLLLALIIAKIVLG